MRYSVAYGLIFAVSVLGGCERQATGTDIKALQAQTNQLQAQVKDLKSEVGDLEAANQQQESELETLDDTVNELIQQFQLQGP